MSIAWTETVTFETLRERFVELGCDRVYVKPLAPNDNYKNQIFVGNDLSEVSFFPSGGVEVAAGSSKKSSFGRFIAHLKIEFEWISELGTRGAEGAQLIYYPQYPEVRLSGILRSVVDGPNELLNPKKRGREPGRLLLCGVNESLKKTFALVVSAESASAVAIRSIVGVEKHGVFSIWHVYPVPANHSRSNLLVELCRIHNDGWIDSKRLTPTGPISYAALNGGGYTLEAELGVLPNGYAAPDFLGWEVKQHSVRKLSLYPSGSVTLFTPEPDGGVYVEAGLENFIRRWGTLKASTGRWNFTGRHVAGRKSSKTNLTLNVVGFKTGQAKFELEGSIQLVAEDGSIAASWSFRKLLDHWKRKHSNAVYVPSLKRVSSVLPQYTYGSEVHLAIGTSFVHFLEGLVTGAVFYDPGIRFTPGDSSKKRNQFRINYRKLSILYESFDLVDVCSCK